MERTFRRIRENIKKFFCCRGRSERPGRKVLRADHDCAKVIVSLNLGNRGSTGHIMRNISALAEQSGYVAYQAYPGSRINLPFKERDIVLCNFLTFKMNRELAKWTGFNGCFAILTTLRFLYKLDKIKPDIIHFHNLHNSYVNLPMLFGYVRSHHIQVVWTLHDCWPFTGRCPHFTMIRCDKWETGCGNCPYPKVQYPPSAFDRTAWLWRMKKEWFTGVERMIIITPSYWLADLVKRSFLREYPVRVIHNGIDLSIFKPTSGDFRVQYGIGNKFMLLGVADSWDVRKGLDVFLELFKRLDPMKYQIVLVGTNDGVDKQLPDGIISIHRTQDQEKLAKIYTAADLFVNPTREDNFPTVNIEALACGTPVITYRTGGSPESLDETCGSVVECDDMETLEQEIKRIQSEIPYSRKSCLIRAGQFDKNRTFREYIEVFDEAIDSR